MPPLPTLKQTIPSAAYDIELVLVPGDPAKNIKPFYISTTEVTWDAFDVFVFGLDGTDKDSSGGGAAGADAISRPSKPYIPPDRGFGHEGYAAICVSAKSAEEFCKWLTAKAAKQPGRTFRLATEDEWECAAHAGTAGVYAWGDDASKANDYAWNQSNSEATTHPVKAKQPNAWGLYDMHGNAREWVKGRDGQPVVKGGGYRDAPEAMTIAARWPFEKAWHATDPQIPKSQWWLSDGSFIGLRIVCDVPAAAALPAGDPLEPLKKTPTQPPPTPPPTPPTPK